MKKRKTIKRLLSGHKVVYVRLSTEKAAEAFFALAQYEGFTRTNEEIKASLHFPCFVRLNEDLTVSFPGYRTWGGAMKFHHSKTENGKKVVKVNFEDML